jgi:hypothetical protein
MSQDFKVVVTGQVFPSIGTETERPQAMPGHPRPRP